MNESLFGITNYVLNYNYDNQNSNLCGKTYREMLASEMGTETTHLLAKSIEQNSL